MVATKEYASYVKEAVKAGADVIISGAGLPIDMPKFVAEAESEADGGEKERRTMIAPIVSSVKSALVICRMWDRKYHTAPDFVVVEGPARAVTLDFQEQLTELGADTDHVAETYDEPAYDKEVRGIIETVKSFAEKYKSISRSSRRAEFSTIRTFCISLNLEQKESRRRRDL